MPDAPGARESFFTGPGDGRISRVSTDAGPQTPALTATPDGFLRHGTPHRIISGGMHYFRVHPDLWRDRLRRLVALGCNTVETYVAWNAHEQRRGAVTFSGAADLGRFLDLAAEEGLDAIVRPGPYICAEWDNGGLPGWLLAQGPMRLRCSDPVYEALVDEWFDVLIPVIAERQAGRGGNVVMVQVENEYGSFGDDTAHLEHLRDGLRSRGITEMLVTSDGAGRRWLTGGTVDGALATVNYGSRTAEVLQMARRELPDQPLMCMEFWIGWFDHWGEEHHTRDPRSAADELDQMLDAGMSVNLYMAHGGTNLDLGAGANAESGVRQPTTTSYDYHAPIAEDGTLTATFRAIREVIARHRDLPPLEEHLRELGIHERPERLSAGPVAVERSVPLATWDGWQAAPHDEAPCHPHPPTFEELSVERGAVLYRREVVLERRTMGESGERRIPPLHLHDLADRAWVLVDGHLAGVAEPTPGRGRPAVIELDHLAGALLGEDAERGEGREVRIEILVESLGRVNFGPLLGDRKGILGGVWHDVRFLNGWQTVPLPLHTLGPRLAEHARTGPEAGPAEHGAPRLVAGSFEAAAPADAHLDVSACGHGVAYVNGACVGRYWSIGPQQSLYVPAPLVRSGRNDVVLLELERDDVSLALVDEPVFSTPSTP